MIHRSGDKELTDEQTISRRLLVSGAGVSVATAFASWSGSAGGQSTLPSHPRLWLTEADLPRLRGWSTADNTIWQDGILPTAEIKRKAMDEGFMPDGDLGSYAYEEYPTENSAEFFAFMSLVHPDAAERDDYAQRARTILMYVMNKAAKGVAEGEPFRDPYFSVFDRSRWWGQAFPLTVDWIYPILTVEDKATIRQVFLRWCDENANAPTTTSNHPEPIGLVNDPALLGDPIILRWAGNNYFTAHMRNIGLMALALDPEDDPDGELGGYLEQATGAWLYMADALLRGDSRGGLPAEGFEYSQQALAYVVQFLLALQTTGQNDPEVWGPQVVLTNNPFWDEMVGAYFHSLSPVNTLFKDLEYLGPLYQPAWYGDGQKYWAPDFIGVFGALGRYDDLTGNTDRLDVLRWIQTNQAPGGAEFLVQGRVAGGEFGIDSILYFLLFDPEAEASVDPRPELPLSYFSPGLGRLLVRTSWKEDATWFTWALGWNSVDHQHADGNQFEFYRNGEWLTKERTGYGFNIGASDYHNTLALENDRPFHYDPGSYTAITHERGSQWILIPTADPKILGRSVTDDYVYALGDATDLYNSEYEESTGIVHASRSIVWLKPDLIIIYDRAESKTDGRFKRFWLNLPTEPEIDGTITTMTTDGGQQLVITTLLPADAAIAAEPAELLEENGEPAVGEPMQFRLRVEAPGGPLTTRFLHVLQGIDGGTSADGVRLIEHQNGTPFAGALIGTTAVLFPVDLAVDLDELTYSVPSETRHHLVTGLAAGGGYDVETRIDGDSLVVSIRAGTTQTADSGGVLYIQQTGP